jgi:hypothetical protein
MLITAYKLAEIAVKAKSLLSNFTLSPPTPGVYCGGTGGGPLTRQTAYAHERRVLKVAEKKRKFCS